MRDRAGFVLHCFALYKPQCGGAQTNTRIEVEEREPDRDSGKVVFVVNEKPSAHEMNFDKRAGECADEGDDYAGPRRITEMKSGCKCRNQESHTRRDIERRDREHVCQDEQRHGHKGLLWRKRGFVVDEGSRDAANVRAREERNGPPRRFGKDRIGVARGAEMGMESVQ